MKNKLPVILIILTVLSVALAVGYTAYERVGSGPGVPKISFAENSIDASVGASDEELLRGVTASDPEDGDVTASLIVESISNMRDGRARISYVAFDSDDHLSRAQRTVRFTDYKKPSFSFTRGMEFRLSGNIDILKYIEAQDVFDGDISDKVKYSIESNAVSLGSVGEHQVTLRVTNSLGDTAHLPITVEVSSDEPNAAGIKLTQYVLYLNEGDEFDAISYVEGYTANDEYHAGADGLRITNDVDTGVPGVYSVKYAYGYGNSESHVRLTVVVE
ncbi:MAG: hypothetical protein SOR56_09370 [Oscillospiraceae bacterium]|nr:hypothetical protein [Oscillospiraceae bacterium]